MHSSTADTVIHAAIPNTSEADEKITLLYYNTEQ